MTSTALPFTAAISVVAALFALTSSAQAATPQLPSQDVAATADSENTPMGWSARQRSSAHQLGLAAAAPMYAFPSKRVFGIDVSSHQGTVNWAKHWAEGKRFVYVKATEGLTYRSPTFRPQMNGAAAQGFIRGAYHFARPMSSSGAAQARAFVAYAGKAPAGGKTLPGVLDIEYNPGKGGMCYKKSQANMRSWIYDFVTTYKKLTKRNAVIYTTAHWWAACTGNTGAFRTTNKLWLANYSYHAGIKPGRWNDHTIWQFSDKPIDQNVFNGSYAQLAAFARRR